MPVYVYKNLTTGATFEAEQRISESALTADPVTGDPVKRLIQPVGIAFKGAGFYVNDSRGKKPASAPARSEGAKPEGAAPESAKPEAPIPPVASKPAPAATATD